jgi:four helix bundle protein
MKNFYEISYGSAKECKYIIYLSYELKYINKIEYLELLKYADEISAMLYKIIKNLKS